MWKDINTYLWEGLSFKHIPFNKIIPKHIIIKLSTFQITERDAYSLKRKN